MTYDYSKSPMDRFGVKKDSDPRCQNPRCGSYGSRRGRGKLLAEELTRPWTIRCPRCGHLNRKA